MIIITLILSVDAILKIICAFTSFHVVFSKLNFTRADASKQPDISWIEIV